MEALGVTCLWLSPVFASPSHHGYDATDYFAVEPRLGTEADLVALFESAHARGMRVLLDFVANHISNEHPIFERATTDAESDRHDWFTFQHWPEDYRSFFNVKTLPQINIDEPAARGHLFEAAAYWLERGADGFRLDYANGPTHAFWAEFRARTRHVQPESLTIGEVVETAELQRSYQGRLDGCLDFLLLQHIRAYLAFGTITTSEFDAFLQRHLRYFPRNFTLPSFLDNHDMNRFLWAVGGDVRKLKLAALLQFALPYPPVVYYGTEVGLSQWHDVAHDDGSRKLEKSRTPMRWGGDQDPDLLNYYKRLITFRREHLATLSGIRETIVAEDDGLYVVQVTCDDSRFIIAVNPTQSEVVLTADRKRHVVVASNDTVTLTGGSWSFPPYSGAVLAGPS